MRGTRLLAGVVVLGLVVGGWFLLTGRALDRVQVSAGAWRCAGTTLDQVEVGAERARFPRMTPGMRCRRTLTVHNGSRTGVTLGAVTVPELGSDGVPGVRVDSIEGRAPRPGSDARVDLGQHLAADAHATVELVVAFRPDGCSPGRTYRTRPTVTLTSWGRSRDLAARPPLTFAATPESDCLGRLRGG